MHTIVDVVDRAGFADDKTVVAELIDDAIDSNQTEITTSVLRFEVSKVDDQQVTTWWITDRLRDFLFDVSGSRIKYGCSVIKNVLRVRIADLERAKSGIYGKAELDDVEINRAHLLWVIIDGSIKDRGRVGKYEIFFIDRSG